MVPCAPGPQPARCCCGFDVRAVRPLMGRIEVELGPGATREEVGDRIRRTFGVANFSYAARTRLDLDVLTDQILREPGTGRRFRVSVRRADKRFPMTSPEVEREVGGRIKSARLESRSRER